MSTTQLLLFEESKEEELERLLHHLEKQMSNLRRGLFARNSELVKMYLENKYELETLKREMCKCNGACGDI